MRNHVWLVGVCKVRADGARMHVDTVIAFGTDEIEAARGAADYMLDIFGQLDGHVFRCARMNCAEDMRTVFRYLQLPNGDELPSELFGKWKEVML